MQSYKGYYIEGPGFLLGTPAYLVKLPLGRVSKAEVIRPADRKRFGYVGDLTDDSEIVLNLDKLGDVAKLMDLVRGE